MQLNLKGPVSRKLPNLKIENENDLLSKNKGEASSIEEQIEALKELKRQIKKTDYEYCLHIFMQGPKRKRADIESSLDPRPNQLRKLNMRNWYAFFESSEDGTAVENYINGPEGRQFRGKAYKIDPELTDYKRGLGIAIKILPGTTKEQLNTTFEGKINPHESKYEFIHFSAYGFQTSFRLLPEWNLAQ